MLEIWKEALDKGNFIDSTFMDPSKASDTLSHNLLRQNLKLKDSL